MTRPYQTRTIKVNGVEVVLDSDVDLAVGDLSGDMDQVAAQMGYVANLWAEAVYEQDCADAYYRQWRAQLTEQILDKDPKLAEWKVKAKIEAHPQFMALKKALAQAESNVINLRSYFDSFSKKANQLQSKGAMSRSELDATGMSTPSVPRPRPKPTPAGTKNRDSAMREALKKKKPRS